MFLFFSSSFAYESLALPLAAFVVWWLGATRHQPGRLVPIVTVISIVAVCVTHHVVGFALTALLGAWYMADRFTKRPTAGEHSVGLMTLVAGTVSLVWFFWVARPAASYLITTNVLPAVQQTVSLVVGHTAARHLYASGGYVAPAWQTVAGFAAVGLLVLAMPPALYRAWDLYFRPRGINHHSLLYRGPMAIAIIVAVIYPLSLVPRLAPDGVAISARSWEYVFTGLGCVLGLLAEERVSRRRDQSRRQPMRTVLVGRPRALVAAGVVTVIFIGNVSVGTAFYQLLPESSHPQGYPWTVQPDAINASNWAREHLGINQRFGANANDALALATYGEQDPVAENAVWPIFFAKVVNEAVVHTIRATRVRYLLVDSQMTKGVPATPGYYFSPQEPGANEYAQPFPAAALRKFTSYTCIHLIYHFGYVQIFDISGIENGSCTPRSISAARNGTEPS